jgi:hypothetical protein
LPNKFGIRRLAPVDQRDELESLTDAFVSAHNGRDWVAMRALLVDRFHVLDHRPVGWGELWDADEYIELLKTAIDLTPDRVFLKGEPIPDAPAGLHRWVARGTDEFGGEMEWEFLGCFIARGGRLSYLELFPMNDVEVAVARVIELRDE